MNKSDLLPSDAAVLDDTLKAILFAHSMLAYTVSWYSDLAQNLTDFERILIKDDWEKLCDDLKKGLEDKWSKADLKEYSETVYEMTKYLHDGINKARENVAEVEKFIQTWNKFPEFVRDTPESLANFEAFMITEMSEQMYRVIETSLNMNIVMEQNILLFKCDPQSEEWKNYVLYLDSIIETGLKDSILCSLQYIAENTNRHNKKLSPFCKIKMILEKEIAFVPSLSENQPGSLFQMFETVIEKIYSSAAKIKRLANPETDYLEAMCKDSDLDTVNNQITWQIKSGVKGILAQLVNYQHYSDIWSQDIDAVLEDFILFGPPPEINPDEEEQPENVSLEMKPPSEEEFKTQILQFDMLLKKIEDIPPEILIVSWLLLDTTSFKESLSSLIRNWTITYKKKFVELKSQGKLRKEEDEGD